MSALVNSMQDLDTISKRLKYLSEAAPEKELFVFYSEDGRRALTALEVYQMSGRFANRLKQEGFQRHDVVCNTLPNSPERVITDLGILFAGCTPMNAHALLADGSDLFHVLKVSKCRAVIVSDEANSNAHKVLQPFCKSDSPHVFNALHHKDLPSLTSTIVVSRKSEWSRPAFLDLVRSPDLETFVETVGPSDLAMIFCTSGSTGYSKLVARTHTEVFQLNIAWSLKMNPGQSVSHPLENTEKRFDDRQLGWIGGYPWATFSNGDSRVLLDVFQKPCSVKVKWDACIKEKCVTLSLFSREVDPVFTYASSQGTLGQKMVIITGGQPLPKPQLSKMLKLADEIFLAYGSTEVMFVSTLFIRDGDYEPFNCGKTGPECEVKVVNASGEVCGPKEFGTIYVRGQFVLKKYFNQLDEPGQQTTKAFTSDGWFNMDDYGCLDEDGRLFVVGRNNDVIMYGAFVVYPGWIEKKILEHPEIHDVFVVPVSDPELYHRICACVKLSAGSQLTTEDLRRYIDSLFSTTQREMTPVPDFIMLLKDLPVTNTGKPSRTEIRQMAEEKFGNKS
ncbi:putative acyl--CoA ligase YdaB [Physella acuta]|uniref:putative acyl--CoA ligase YdaB n=1 Tax=Physella acuta TaxID=109671 RepID=UPI0027DD147D|nr:putative acyl--CoA ligase YdaB [Physella acuta]